jgi:uncharacterized membrane protein
MAEVDINAAPADVAGVMFDPQREPEWMKVVSGVELIDQALEPGARVKRTGAFMGHEFGWTTQVESVHFPHVLVLRIVEGPISGGLKYEIQRSGHGSRVRIKASGQVPALAFLPAAAVQGPAQSALTSDLTRLKALVENASTSPSH